MRQQDVEKIKKLKGKALRYFLSGFIDGEGSFNISFAYFSELRSKIKVNPKFQLYQHEDHREILDIAKEVFKIGRVDKKWGSNVLAYTVDGVRNNREKIVPFFDKYPLATKQEDFEKFKKILEILADGWHLTKEKLLAIVEIAYSMNKNGKQRKYVKERLIALIEENFNNTDSKISSETTRQTLLLHSGDDIVRGLRKEEDNV